MAIISLSLSLSLINYTLSYLKFKVFNQSYV